MSEEIDMPTVEWVCVRCGTKCFDRHPICWKCGADDEGNRIFSAASRRYIMAFVIACGVLGPIFFMASLPIEAEWWQVSTSLLAFSTLLIFVWKLAKEKGRPHLPWIGTTLIFPLSVLILLFATYTLPRKIELQREYLLRRREEE